MTVPIPDHLARYASVIDDFDAFATALSCPLPQTIAVNSLRIEPARIPELFASQIELTPVPWCPGAWRLSPEDRPGRLWGFTAGLYTVQEEASLLPARLLAARPGHRVLDLCAAPGNKTAHLALALGNRGTVIANDLKVPRLQALYDLCRRLGLSNISISGHDGSVYPVDDAQFDRILVDAPCTSEGKAQRGHVRASSARFRTFIQGQQRALLRRAVDLCRPGGRIVYSTCTFAPEENEAVVSEVLETSRGRLRALPAPVTVPGAAAGLQAFGGRSYHPDLVHAQRLWPHRTGTGGFFAILLERCDAPTAPQRPPRMQSLPPPAPTHLLADGFERFGIPLNVLDDMQLGATGRSLRLIPRDHAPPAGIRLEAIGLECAQLSGERARLATGGLLTFGSEARRNVIDLDATQLECWRRRQDQTLPPATVTAASAGAVLVRHAGLIQGGGLLRTQADGVMRLESQCPKAWATPALAPAAGP
ncbi:MAG: RsmB/NOP family class I SAM-dependent RNA methyltransferase [Gammaproteobacteria bacterium]|nr:MAG: RsmB/NOP family class I SAM-dependent RNA methyltransferase [Gammaproteobacteria bacterium]